MNKKSKIVALVMTVLFTITSTLQAAPSAYTVQIPEQYAKATQRFKGSDERLIIIVQDAHDNLGVQMNMSETIKALLPTLQESIAVEKKGFLSLFRPNVPFVGLEGAYETYDLDRLQRLPALEAKQSVAREFVKNGTFSGAEHAAITAQTPFCFTGLEDRALFMENMAAYTRVLGEKTEVVGVVNEINVQVAGLKEAMYGSELREFDANYTVYKNDPSQLMQCIGSVYQQVHELQIDLLDYMQLFQFKDILALQNQINNEALQMELEKIVNVLVENDPVSSVQDMYVAYKEGKIEEKWFAEYVRASALKNNIGISSFYNIERVYHYNKKFTLIDFQKLQQDIRAVSRVIETALATNAEEKKLIAIDFFMEEIKHLVTLSLTKDRVQAMQAEDPVRGCTHVLEDLALLLAQHSANGGAVSGNVRDVLHESITRAQHFYACADKRDMPMVDNLLREMDAKEQRIGVLVAGGYHLQGVTDILREKGISFVTVMPNVDAVVSDIAFEARMTGQIAPLHPAFTSYFTAMTQAITTLTGYEKVQNRFEQNVLGRALLGDDGNVCTKEEILALAEEINAIAEAMDVKDVNKDAYEKLAKTYASIANIRDELVQKIDAVMADGRDEFSTQSGIFVALQALLGKEVKAKRITDEVQDAISEKYLALYNTDNIDFIEAMIPDASVRQTLRDIYTAEKSKRDAPVEAEIERKKAEIAKLEEELAKKKAERNTMRGVSSVGEPLKDESPEDWGGEDVLDDEVVGYSFIEKGNKQKNDTSIIDADIKNIEKGITEINELLDELTSKKAESLAQFHSPKRILDYLEKLEETTDEIGALKEILINVVSDAETQYNTDGYNNTATLGTGPITISLSDTSDVSGSSALVGGAASVATPVASQPDSIAMSQPSSMTDVAHTTLNNVNDSVPTTAASGDVLFTLNAMNNTINKNINGITAANAALSAVAHVSPAVSAILQNLTSVKQTLSQANNAVTTSLGESPEPLNSSVSHALSTVINEYDALASSIAGQPTGANASASIAIFNAIVSNVTDSNNAALSLFQTIHPAAMTILNTVGVESLEGAFLVEMLIAEAAHTMLQNDMFRGNGFLQSVAETMPIAGTATHNIALMRMLDQVRSEDARSTNVAETGADADSRVVLQTEKTISQAAKDVLARVMDNSGVNGFTGTEGISIVITDTRPGVFSSERNDNTVYLSAAAVEAFAEAGVDVSNRLVTDLFSSEFASQGAVVTIAMEMYQELSLVSDAAAMANMAKLYPESALVTAAIEQKIEDGVAVDAAAVVAEVATQVGAKEGSAVYARISQFANLSVQGLISLIQLEDGAAVSAAKKAPAHDALGKMVYGFTRVFNKVFVATLMQVDENNVDSPSLGDELAQALTDTVSQASILFENMLGLQGESAFDANAFVEEMNTVIWSALQDTADAEGINRLMLFYRSLLEKLSTYSELDAFRTSVKQTDDELRSIQKRTVDELADDAVAYENVTKVFLIDDSFQKDIVLMRANTDNEFEHVLSVSEYAAQQDKYTEDVEVCYIGSRASLDASGVNVSVALTLDAGENSVARMMVVYHFDLVRLALTAALGKGTQSLTIENVLPGFNFVSGDLEKQDALVDAVTTLRNRVAFTAAA